jgi:NAD(P)-dependent dehydrogenase (short-subunit alcohol dehydrogenase family)
LVVITGANRGIGLGLTRRYSADGWRVIATARDPDEAAELNLLGASGAAVTVERLDLADGASIAAFADRMGDSPIDLLINNAGTMGPQPLSEHIHRQRFGGIDYELWAEVLLTNTLGSVRLTEALADNVASSDRGAIVMISSTAGSIGGSDRPAIAYTTSKAALNKATTIIARELAPRGVVVFALCPGHVKTRLGSGGATVEVDDSVKGIVQVIESATADFSGAFLRYNGESIPW